MRLRFRLSVLSAVLVTAPLGAQRGAIVGHVTDKTSGAPVPAAEVIIAGTTRGAATGSNGRYQILSLPAGTAVVRVLRIGFESQNKTVTVTDGVTDTVDFVLTPSVVTLDVVTVSATGGEQRQRELGNTIATIAPDSVAQGSVASLSDLLNSRAAGVDVVQQSGTTGAASRIRIRGSSSVSLANDPLIVIDGVRVNSDANSASVNLGTGGQTVSRIDDLNADDIENIEVLKGPAASALYGTAGANGVIQVTTKHGAAGRTQWNSHGEYGSVKQFTDYPANYGGNWLALDPAGAVIPGDTVTNPRVCSLSQQNLPSGCQLIASSVHSFNPINALTPFVTGYRYTYGLSASGGTEALTYYLNADDYREQGVNANNTVRRTNLRANFKSRLSSDIDASVNVGYLQSRLALPQNDNSFYGILGLALLGNAVDDPVGHGYFAGITPALVNKYLTQQNVDRFTTSGEISWHPTSWFNGIALGGLDYNNRYDNNFLPANVIANGNTALGFADPAPYSLYNYTANLTGQFKFDVTSSIRSTSSLGTQFVDEVTNGLVSTARGIVPGTNSLQGATTQFTTTSDTPENVTFGGFGSQEFAWRDKVFLTGAVRADENSAFGTKNNLVWYPNVSASWVVGEEPFFPKTSFLSSLRLRGALGESGTRPGFRQAETYRTAVTARFNGNDQGALALTGVGTQFLKPELSREIEGGLDAGFFKNRINVQFSYYDKTTSDALILKTIEPSACGFTTGPNPESCVIFQNLGKVNNNGFELGINGTLVDTRIVRFEMGVNGSENNNKLLTLGKGQTPEFFDAAIDGNTQTHTPGHALGAYYVTPYTYKDLNHDGIIEQNELTLGKNSVFVGNPFPKGEWTLAPAITLFKYVRVSSLFDRRYGSKTLNFTEEFRCFSSFNCQGEFDRHASLRAQAAVVGVQLGTDYGYIEDNAFWKWRELAVTLTAPDQWAHRVKVSTLSLQLAARNLKTWTNYSGYDPEINFASTAANFTTSDFTTQPQVRYLTARINLGF
jgi:TonB-linked SusC/RagA family outer membrane protein